MGEFFRAPTGALRHGCACAIVFHGLEEMMGRRDHSFLFRDSDGREGIAFCRAGDFDRGEAKTEVKRVLASASGGWKEVAYLGPLSYEEMDAIAAELLGAFAKHDPVWFAYLSPGPVI